MKIRNTNKTLWLLGMILACWLATSQLAIAQQGNLARPAASEADFRKLTVGQKQWLKLLPILTKHRKARIDAVSAHIDELRSVVSNASSRLSTESFAEEMVGLEAMIRASQSREKVESYIAAAFSKHVLDVDALVSAVQRIADSLHAKNTAISNECILECKLDLNIDPGQLAKLAVDWSQVRVSYQQQSAMLKTRMYDTVAESLTASGVGLAAGYLGESIGSSFGRDSNGNRTWTSALLGLAACGVAEHYASKAALDVMKTKGKMEASTQQAAEAILGSVIGKGGDFSAVEFGLVKQVNHHDIPIFAAIAREFGLDRDWLLQNLPKIEVEK